MVYLVVVIAYVYFYGGYVPGKVLIFDSHRFSHMFDVLPTICFGYQCHVSSVPIYYSIKGKSKSKYFTACSIAMLCCALVYTFSANFGYLTFGGDVNTDLLLSYDSNHPGALAIHIAIIVLAFKSITTYPVLMFCVREAVVSFYVSAKGYTEEEAAETERTRRYIVVTILWLISLLCALMAADIDVVVRLLGSLAVFFIFILPGYCLFVHTINLEDLGSTTRKNLYLARGASFFYILLGVFTFGLSLSLAIESAFFSDDRDGPAPLCIPYFNITTTGSVSGRIFTPSRFAHGGYMT